MVLAPAESALEFRDHDGEIALGNRVTDAEHWTRRKDVRVHELDGEAFIYDPSTADTHRLNETAYYIWQRCDASRRLSDIAGELADEYDVDLAEAAAHVARIVSDFVARRLVVPANEPLAG